MFSWFDQLTSRAIYDCLFSTSISQNSEPLPCFAPPSLPLSDAFLASCLPFLSAPAVTFFLCHYCPSVPAVPFFLLSPPAAWVAETVHCVHCLPFFCKIVGLWYPTIFPDPVGLETFCFHICWVRLTISTIFQRPYFVVASQFSFSFGNFLQFSPLGIPPDLVAKHWGS